MTTIATPSPLLRPRVTLLMAGLLAAMVSAAPMFGGTISLLILPVSQEFGWARSVFPMAIMAAACAGGLAAPLAGRVIDRLGPRSVMLVGLVVFGLMHGLLALSDGSRGSFFAVYVVLGAASSFSGGIGITRVISQAFEAGRARALGLSIGVGAGLGAALTPLLTESAIQAHGWRAAYLVLGAYVWTMAIPAVWLWFPRRGAGARSPGERGEEPGLSIGEAARTREFWLLVAIILLNGLVVGATTGHWAPMQVERGVSLAGATALLSAFGLIKIVAQVGGGILLDRFQTPRMALLIVTPIAAGVALFALGSGFPAIAAGAVLFGLGEGAEFGLLPYLASRYFGLRRFGEVVGWLMAANIFASGASNVLMGHMFDVTGSYQAGLWVLTIAATMAIAAAAGLGRYRFGASSAT